MPSFFTYNLVAQYNTRGLNLDRTGMCHRRLKFTTLFWSGKTQNIYPVLEPRNYAKSCIVLYCTVLYCTVLYCTALHCTALHCTALHCTALHCTALHCIALHWIASHHITLHHIESCCVVLYCIGDKGHIYALLI